MEIVKLKVNKFKERREQFYFRVRKILKLEYICQI